MEQAAAQVVAAPINVTVTFPALNEGEHYAGILIENGVPKHHLVLLPGELERASWREAMKWAAEQGGELPTRKEQALLFANAAEHFQPRWYWSGEQYAGDDAYAWFQGFGYGHQYYYHKDDSYRARAVRRVPIQ